MYQFELVENEELKITDNSSFGLQFGPVTISSIGVADDVALLSPTICGLQGLLIYPQNSVKNPASQQSLLKLSYFSINQIL